MRVGTIWGAAAMAALALASLSACDQKLASQPARDHRSVDSLPTTSTTSASEQAGTVTTVGGGAAPASSERAEASPSVAAEPVKLVEGKPIWADNRRHSAQDNAEYQFERHGKELGARNLDDFVVKAHHFVNEPPTGALTLTRSNGDKLLYDPKSGLFGVVRSDGAPRTVIHPAEGQAFWDKQVEENRNGGSSYRRNSPRGGGDQG